MLAVFGLAAQAHLKLCLPLGHLGLPVDDDGIVPLECDFGFPAACGHTIQLVSPEVQCRNQAPQRIFQRCLNVTDGGIKFLAAADDLGGRFLYLRGLGKYAKAQTALGFYVA